MAPPDRFDEFVASASHRLLPTALRLTGDPALADELVQEALAKARPGSPPPTDHGADVHPAVATPGPSGACAYSRCRF